MLCASNQKKGASYRSSSADSNRDPTDAYIDSETGDKNARSTSSTSLSLSSELPNLENSVATTEIVVEATFGKEIDIAKASSSQASSATGSFFMGYSAKGIMIGASIVCHRWPRAGLRTRTWASVAFQ